MPSTLALGLGCLAVAGVLLIAVLLIALTDNECANRSDEH